MAAGRNRTATSSHSETRTVWLPDEWAVYIANGDDPESPDWPIELCEEELRRLRLEGFDTVTCTGRTTDLQEYRGVAGTLRAYEALRVGGDDVVTRTVTLVQERLSLPGGEVARKILLDAKVALTRTESQPAERLAARAVLEATGRERRVAELDRIEDKEVRMCWRRPGGNAAWPGRGETRRERPSIPSGSTSTSSATTSRCRETRGATGPRSTAGSTAGTSSRG